MFEEELRSAVGELAGRLKQVFDSGDPSALAEILRTAHDNIHVFVGEHPYRLDGKAAFEKLLRSHFGQPGEINILFHQPVTEVYGDAAIVMAYAQIEGLSRSGVPYSRYGKFSATFVRSDGHWRMVALHTSPLIEGVTEAGLLRRAYAGLAALGLRKDRP